MPRITQNMYMQYVGKDTLYFSLKIGGIYSNHYGLWGYRITK